MKITDVRRQLRRWRASNPRVSALLTPVSAASGAVTERGDARARDVATRSAERLVADAAPQSRYVGVQQVPLRRLDEAAAAYFGEARNLYLRAQGFVPWTLLPGFVDDATGRTLQIDAVFLKP